MDLQKLIHKLKKIKALGFVQSHRAHNTGIGKTLEDYLDITENNIALPDFGVMELKSQRVGTTSMMTLFTKKPEGITNAEILKRFGYPDPQYPKHMILHQTIIKRKKNARGNQNVLAQKPYNLWICTNSIKSQPTLKSKSIYEP